MDNSNARIVNMNAEVQESNELQDISCHPVAMGEIRNDYYKSYCIDTAGTSGRGVINLDVCDGYQDQQIMRCTDGTIRNNAGNYCL